MARDNKEVKSAKLALALQRKKTDLNTSSRRELVECLCNLSECLGATEKWLEASTYSKEALEIETDLAITDSDEISNLAFVLKNHWDNLRNSDQADEALWAVEAGLTVIRKMCEKKLNFYQRDLATTLQLYSQSSKELGFKEKSLLANEEEVSIYRSRANNNSILFSHFYRDYAESLKVYGNNLFDIGEIKKALDVVGELVQVYRKLTSIEPKAFLFDLSQVLWLYSSYLKKDGRKEEALKAMEESVVILRQLSQGNLKDIIDVGLKNTREAIISLETSNLDKSADSDYEYDRRRILFHFTESLWSAGHREEALEVMITRINSLRKTNQVNGHNTYLSDLANALNSYGLRLNTLGRLSEALEACKESEALIRILIKDKSWNLSHELAASLENQSLILSNMQLNKESLEAMREVLEIRHSVVTIEKSDFGLNRLAWCLNTYGRSLRDNGFVEKSLDPINEALEIHRKLASSDTTRSYHYLITSLQNYSLTLSKLGKHESAISAIQEAVEIGWDAKEKYIKVWLPLHW